MNDTITITEAATFTAYEYTALRVPRSKEALYRDTYEAFGWTVDAYDTALTAAGSVTLNLKRDRRLGNRDVLLELQRSAEDSLQAINQLEKSPTTVAGAASISVGVLGAALFAGAVFAMQADLLVLEIVLGALGAIGWALPWFLNRTVKNRQAARLAPRIAREYDALQDSCQRAVSLLA